MNTLVIGDTHEPFSHKRYFNFIRRIRDKYKCSKAVHIGDVVDFHSLNYHEKETDSMGIEDEILATRKSLQKWYKEFPNLKVALGNHDKLIHRKAKTFGIPQSVVLSIGKILEAPKGWEWANSHEVDGVLYKHSHSGGQNAHKKAAMENHQSVIIGHYHSRGCVDYMANHSRLIFAGFSGCGIDINAYAMRYGYDGPRPVLGCCVVTDNGKEAVFKPMQL